MCNSSSFTIAAMGAATVFSISRGQVANTCKMTITITGLVTLIAFHHCFRILNGWTEACTVANKVTPTSVAFNDGTATSIGC